MVGRVLIHREGKLAWLRRDATTAHGNAVCQFVGPDIQVQEVRGSGDGLEGYCRSTNRAASQYCVAAAIGADIDEEIRLYVVDGRRGREAGIRVRGDG